MTTFRQAIELAAGTAALTIWLGGCASIAFIIGG